MVDYNPRELKELPKVGVLKVSVPQVPLMNVFGEVIRKGYEIVKTDAPYLLWEDGTPMLWEDGEDILLEQSKMKVWLTAERLATTMSRSRCREVN